MTSTAIPSPKGETLKPCPFCGGEAVVREYPAYRIAGKPCGASTFGIDCTNCGIETNKYASDGPAIRDWNTRSHSSSDDVRREALEEAPGWQSIESADLELCARAPCLVTADGAAGEARYFPDEEGWWWADYAPTDYLDRRCYPSHWMPLPAPASPSFNPVVQEKKDE